MNPSRPAVPPSHPTPKAHFDVFDGGADGLCALHQLRLVMPRDAILVSGVKRDCALLGRVAHANSGDSVTALGIPLDVNRQALMTLLARGVDVEYIDHRRTDDIPRSSRLTATIGASPQPCTAMLVDRHLHGRHRIWAVAGAFGAGLTHDAEDLAKPLCLVDGLLNELRALGDALSYNASGDTDADVVVHPAAIYRALARYSDPFDFMRYESVFERIDAARRDDLALARLEQPDVALDHATAHLLPDEPWSRRVRDTFVNDLANREPDRAHAVLTPNVRHGYTVSVRASLAWPREADALCRKLAAGGGDAAAGGIDHLSVDDVPAFIRELDAAFGQTQAA